MLTPLRRSIEVRRDEMADFLAELIAIDTQNPPGRNYERCLSAIARRLEALDIPCAVEAVPGGGADPDHPRHWLHARIGPPGPAVYFHGHVDVVPANGPRQFEPRVSESTVTGRGSADMKGGLVSMIYAMRALAESGATARVALRIVPDEETGGALGSARLRDEGRLFEPDAIAMLTAEPTGDAVWHASRGAVTGRVVLEGRPSHVGLQHRGINAFERALEVQNALAALKREVEARTTSFPLEPEPARHSILMMGGEVTGKGNFNVVPDLFAFSVDRRINPEEDWDEERRRLIATVESAGARFEVFQEARPAATSEADPAAAALAASIEEVTGARAAFELCPGILEIRFYRERGVPAFAYGPGLLSVAHAPGEFIERGRMESVAVVYALAAERIVAGAGAGSPG